jgi:hypothetical protein
MGVGPSLSFSCYQVRTTLYNYSPASYFGFGSTFSGELDLDLGLLEAKLVNNDKERDICMNGGDQ